MFTKKMAATLGRRLLLEFIQKYKELHCLWKVSDEDYRNKRKRLIALKQLLRIMQKSDPNANIDTVTKKINSLRSSFNKEHNKVKVSLQSGIDDVHVPKLWYYDLMSFLIDKESDTGKPMDMATVMCDTKSENEDFEFYEEKESPVSPCPSDDSDHTNLTNHYQRSASWSVPQKNDTERPRRKFKPSATKALTRIANRLNVQKSKQKYSAFGEHVAEKLRDMDNRMATYCVKLINDAIFHAQCENLSYSSCIVTKPHCSERPHTENILIEKDASLLASP